jgi:hypothetical protein
MTKKAFLITGFSNWGKTSLLRLIVKGNASKQFNCGPKNTISINGQDFSIQQHSNDDLNIDDLLDEVKKRIGNNAPNLLIAFCPTNEPNNDSRELLELLTKKEYSIEIIFLKNRWGGHASLNINLIKTYYARFNITYHVIKDSDDAQSALNIIK